MFYKVSLMLQNLVADILKGFFRSHYGPGVNSASSRNEYQEYFLGVKAVSA